MKESKDRCSGLVLGKHVLSIQDSTELNYQSHAGRLDDKDPDLGPVGNDHDIGFFLHPSLVVDSESEFPFGFSDIYCWNRHYGKLDKHQRRYKELPIESKESYRWIASAQASKKCLKPAASVTIVADREGDIYEGLALIPDEKTHLLIRSSSDRLLYDEDEKLFSYLSGQPLAGRYQITLKGDNRCDRKGRVALLEVRWAKVKIKRPAKLVNKNDYPAYIELTAIEVREHPSSVPPKEAPILWRLLTTHEIDSFENACEIIRWYRLRWLIEQLFRTLKRQGLDIEASQLERGASLKKLAIMALQAALRIMQLVQERDGKAQQPAEVVFNKAEIECLENIGPHYEGQTEKQKNPFCPYSLAWAAWIIARLGGWKGYPSESPPGPITMKRGLEAFEWIRIGWGAGKIYSEQIPP